LFWSCIDVIVVRVKVSRGIAILTNGDRQCDTIQSPNGETCTDKSHLLSNNPDRQWYRYSTAGFFCACMFWSFVQVWYVISKSVITRSYFAAGMYAEMERLGTNLNEIDTTDCENSLESLQVKM